MSVALTRPGSGSRTGEAATAARADMNWPIWWMTFLSLSCFNLAIGLGVVLLMLFIATWTLYFLAWPAKGLDRMARTLLPWAFPVLALLSTIWSQAPEVTLRLALEMLVVTGIGILIAQAQSMRSFISAFMCTMLLSVVVGAVLGGKAAVGIRGDTALVGIFGSKNNFALMISFMMLTCGAVLLDPKQPRVFRILGIVGCLIGPPFLIMAKSLGAIVTLGIAFGSLGIFSFLSRMPARSRSAFYIGGLLLGVVFIGAFLLLQSTGVLEMLLRSVGKDVSLTGRTYLWSRADWLIPLNPLLGVGYQAFWVQEAVEAEGLWRTSKVAARMGFHFHNLFYETVIELGYLGVAVLGTTLAALVVAVFTAAIRRPRMEHSFFVAVVVILGVRTYVELDFISPFSIGTLLLPILWSYCVHPSALQLRPSRRQQPGAAAAPAR